MDERVEDSSVSRASSLKMKVMVKRPALKKPLSTGSAEELARAHARLEAQVTNGNRDPQSLHLIPAAMARAAKLTFPPHPFGRPKDW